MDELFEKSIIRVKKEEAVNALKEAVEKDDIKAVYFWSGYLAALW